MTTQLYLAFSADGLQWTPRHDAWLAAGDDSLGLLSGEVYRSAFAEVGDSLRFWYSGAATEFRAYTCHRGQAVCADSVLRWGGLGSETRFAADVLPRGLRRDR